MPNERTRWVLQELTKSVTTVGFTQWMLAIARVAAVFCFKINWWLAKAGALVGYQRPSDLMMWR